MAAVVSTRDLCVAHVQYLSCRVDTQPPTVREHIELNIHTRTESQ